MFQEIYEIKAQNPHNAKASETNLFYLLRSAGSAAGWVFKGVPATPPTSTETFHIVLFEVSIRVSAEGFGDLRGSL